MSTLGPRLCCLAGLVRPGSRLADIGTDHAALPVALVQAGTCPRAIASDVRTGPLASARHAVEAAGLGGRIELRLGDGLTVLAPDEADDIVIAGMGGETIAAILEGAPWLRRAPSPYRLLLQPMSRPEALRRYLLSGGFILEEEPVVQEGEHLYSVLCVRYTGVPPVTDAVAFYMGAIDAAAGPEAKAYLDKVRQRLLRRAQGLAAARRDTDSAEIEQLRALARRLGYKRESGGNHT